MNKNLLALSLLSSLVFSADTVAQYYTVRAGTKIQIRGVDFSNYGRTDYFVHEVPNCLEVTIEHPKTIAAIWGDNAGIKVDVSVQKTAESSQLQLIDHDASLTIEANYCQAVLEGTYCAVEISGAKNHFKCAGKKNSIMLTGTAYANTVYVEGRANDVHLDWGADQNQTEMWDFSGQSTYTEDGINYPWWFDNRAWMNGRQIS